jgi:hypothetical protein
MRLFGGGQAQLRLIGCQAGLTVGVGRLRRGQARRVLRPRRTLAARLRRSYDGPVPALRLPGLRRDDRPVDDVGVRMLARVVPYHVDDLPAFG